MEVTREAYSILGASLLTLFVLLTFDIYKVWHVPLGSIGAVHWIPELLAIFLLSHYLAENCSSRVRLSIFAVALVFPLLVYGLSQFGAFTTCIFSITMLIGFFIADVKKEVKKSAKLFELKCVGFFY